ncbi:MAG: hypothetical protein HDS68_04650 [Bacteroidales bacterium]|nr:hypothetical protein [Bacteroidales bacterium]
MKKCSKYIVVRPIFAVGMLMITGLVTGCLKNDIPYPRIQPDFTEITADGLIKDAEIDTDNRMVTLSFDENVDIHNVEITSYALTPGARIVSGNLDKPIDLSKYYITTLRLYQDYDWVIQGKQDITRYFTVENQVGATIIDVIGHRVVVTVSGRESLKTVKVLTMKLGSENAVQIPDLTGETISLERPVEVTVSEYGRDDIWTIYGEFVDSSVETVSADAWSQVCWVYGSGVAGKDNGVEYRIAGSNDWVKVSQSWITHTGGTFCARIINLNPLTEYEARAYSDAEYGEIIKFITGGVVQVPNTTLSEWSKDGKVWNPWAEGDEPYWGTGNKGATTLGESNTVPTEDTSSGTGLAAKLETRFVGIGTIGKLAAGNIFVGSYLRTEGTNGVLSMGRPFTERPTKLRGYLKYESKPISHTNNEYTHLKGEPDTCIVWCALIDSAEPLEIRTNPANRNLFEPTAGYVVAYGKFQSGQTIPEYIPFEFDLEYMSTSRVPKYILITASASKYGDFFTGGNGSVLCIDDLELLYDY